MTTNLYLVRHADYPKIPGDERMRGLSDEGHAASRRVCQILEAEKIDLIVSSPFRSAVQTVEPLARLLDLEIMLNESLKEKVLHGEGMYLDERHFKRFTERSFVDQDFSLAGGESLHQARKRSIDLVNYLCVKYGDRKIVASTHGLIIAIILNYFDKQYDYRFWDTMTRPDIYKIVFRDNNFREVKRLWTPAISCGEV
jgi:2,3-bisphosphoglycerate-dependent phosphoglycerate mutase